MSYCRTLGEEGEVFRRRSRHFHEWRQGMRVRRHEDHPLHEQCRAGDRRLYSRNGNAEVTGTAAHAHAEALTAAHGGQDACQDPQAQHQYDDTATATHAFAPASNSLVGRRIASKAPSCTNPRVTLYLPILWPVGQPARRESRTASPAPAHEKEGRADPCGIRGQKYQPQSVTNFCSSWTSLGTQSHAEAGDRRYEGLGRAPSCTLNSREAVPALRRVMWLHRPHVRYSTPQACHQ